MAMILVCPSGRPLIASRTESLASACMIDAPPSAFGSMMASGFAGAMASRSASVRPVCSAVARFRLAVECNGVFEVDDQRIRATGHRLVEFFRAIGGNEEQ